MPERTAIHGKDFLDWLERGGITPANTRRVVIDAQVGHATLIYVEGMGSRGMIDVDPPAELRGAVVRVVE